MSRDRSDFGSSQTDERPYCSHNETSTSDEWRMSPLTVAVILIIMAAMFTWGGYLWGGK
jgi:hypothetical protein